MTLKQGQIRWANLPAPAGRRPVLLLTRDAVINARSNITIAPITRTTRGLATEVALTPADGVKTNCAVNLDTILTVPAPLLDQLIVMLPAKKLKQVWQAIHDAFAMPF